MGVPQKQLGVPQRRTMTYSMVVGEQGSDGLLWELEGLKLSWEDLKGS